MQLYVSHQFLQLRSGRIRSSGPQTASDDGTHAAKRTRSDPNLSTTHLNLVCWFCPGLGPVLVYLFRSERHHPTWPDEGVMSWLTWFCLHTAGNCPDVLSETSGGFKLTNVPTHLPPRLLTWKPAHTHATWTQYDTYRNVDIWYDYIWHKFEHVWFYSGNIWRIRYWTQTRLKLNVDVVLCLLDV